MKRCVWLAALVLLVMDYLRWCAHGLEKKCLELQAEEPRADPRRILAGVQEAMLTHFVVGAAAYA